MEHKNFALFIWNVAAVVCIDGTSWIGELASFFPGILGIIDISDIMHSFDQEKSSSISQLINGQSRDLQTFTQIF